MKRIIPMLFVLSYFIFNIVHAGNYSFLDYSATFHLQGDDVYMMKANLTHALDSTPDGQKSSWKNAKTGSWGYVMPSHTVKQHGTVCRQLKIYNNAHHTPGESSYQFCKINHEWKIVNR